MGIRRAILVLLYLGVSGAVYGAGEVPYPEGHRDWAFSSLRP